MVKEIYPHKAVYHSDEPVKILVSCDSAVTVELEITSLWKLCKVMTADCQAGENILEIGLYEHGGYQVRSGECFTAFDVSPVGEEPFRFGFLSRFLPSDEEDEADVKQMLTYHITAVQFYDWMYRHHQLLSEEDVYTDAMGRMISGETVRKKIQTCHTYGMKAIAYGAVYGAEAPYTTAHPDQILYKSCGGEFDLIDFIKIMNIQEGSPWCRHIINEFRDAVRVMDFDGIHLDQYGYPKSALSSTGELIYLEDEFLPLINECMKELREEKEIIWNTFNAVNNWPIEQVAQSDVKSLYIEVWKPFDTYNHLRKLIREARLLNPAKPVTLAAYIEPFCGDYPEREKEVTLLLASAVIYASGGSHLVLGEENGILSDPYYVNYSRYSDKFISILRSYADFIVKYRDWLFDRTLREGTDTYLSVTGKDQSFADNCSGQVVLNGAPFSVNFEADHIGVLFFRNRRLKILHLINLIGNNCDWNEIKKVPEELLEAVEAVIVVDEKITGVYFTSPDYDSGDLFPLDWEEVSHDHGRAIKLRVPSLFIWSMVVITTEGSLYE